MEKNCEIGIEEMLRARDRRVARQCALLKTHGVPLISLTMNIAGSIKYDCWIERAFREGLQRIEHQLIRHNASVLARECTIAPTGCEHLWAVDAPADALKSWMCAIEEADELGRLFDADVIDRNGDKCSRAGEARRCLICGQPAAVCGRSRAHSAQALFQRAHEIIERFFLDQFCEWVGMCAEKSLLYEAITTPKPGLVDCEDSGAHRDMDLFTFVNSASALRDYFIRCVRIGHEMCKSSSEAIFARLQYEGMCAETRMMEATANVNTHKGALFSLGLLCCAAGVLFEQPYSRKNLLECASKLAQPSLQKLESLSPESARTGGEHQFIQMGLTGARGEAASGFQSVQKYALPVLEKALKAGKSANEAGLEALIGLMSAVADSNILRRGGIQAQQMVFCAAQDLMHQDIDVEKLRKLNKKFIQENISPGGCADLLAVAWFLHLLDRYAENCTAQIDQPPK